MVARSLTDGKYYPMSLYMIYDRYNPSHDCFDPDMLNSIQSQPLISLSMINGVNFFIKRVKIPSLP